MIVPNHKKQTLNYDNIIAVKCHYDAGFHMPTHKDDFSKISIILDGDFSEKTIDGSNSVLNNTTLITKPNTAPHENTFGKNGCTILSIQFTDDKLVPGICNELAYYHHPAVIVLGLKIWTQLCKVKNDKSLGLLVGELTNLIQCLHQQTRKNNIHDAALLLTSQTTEKRIVQQVSHQLSLHRTYLSRAFKKQFQISPASFNKKQRLINAVQYLNTTEHTLASVAYEAGFSDQSHFNRFLKKEMLCTPMELRNYLLENRLQMFYTNEFNVGRFVKKIKCGYKHSLA